MGEFDKETQRLRFWALKDAIDAAEEKIAPLRKQRDDETNRLAAELKARDEKLMAPIRKIEADVLGVPMFEAKQEMAFLARGLQNVGERPESTTAKKG